MKTIRVIVGVALMIVGVSLFVMGFSLEGNDHLEKPACFADAAGTFAIGSLILQGLEKRRRKPSVLAAQTYCLTGVASPISSHF